MRYSYILHFQQDYLRIADLSRRWQKFLGEFAKPIADKYPDLLFWCSYYGNCARFRIHTTDRAITEFVIKQIKSSQLIFKENEEEALTLRGDLGASRFIDQSLGAEACCRRAELILKMLCATVRVYLDGLTNENGEWTYRQTIDKENPLGNNFESLAHLIANISHFEFDVSAAGGTIGTAWHRKAVPPSHSIRCRLW